jgi:dienelactone hydrolase/NAD-dependent SIR2 family protein deacetylase
MIAACELFARVVLRGLAQIAFADQACAGLLILAATALLSPWGALGALFAAVLGTAAGRLPGACPRQEWLSGVTGYNSAIIGILWGGFPAAGGLRLALLLFALALCLALETGLRRLFRRFGLPILSLPAVLAAVGASLLLAPQGTWLWIQPAETPFGLWGLVAALVCVLAAATTKSMAGCLQAAALGTVTMLLQVWVADRDPSSTVGLWALTVPLASFALHGVFLRGAAGAAGAGMLAAIAAAAIWLAWMSSPLAGVVHPLVTPFVLGVWIVLLLQRGLWRQGLLDPAFWRILAVLAAARLRGRRLVAVTGGELSALSGLPDRAAGSEADSELGALLQGGETFASSAAVRRRYWEACAHLRDELAQAAANPGHRALARMERLGALGLLITQNVDTLQHRADSKRVVQLYGSLDAVTCAGCGSPADWPQRAMWRRFDLACPSCRGLLRPAGRLSGETLGPDAWRAIMEDVESAAAVVFIGLQNTGPEIDRLLDAARRGQRRVVVIGANQAPFPLRAGEIALKASPTAILPILAAYLAALSWLPLPQGQRRGQDLTAPRPFAMGRPLAWTLGAALLAGVFVLGEQTLSTATFAGRGGTLDIAVTEKVRFQSFDADRKAIARNAYRTAPVEIPGDLILPDAGGRLPLAILMHGSDGLSEHQYRYAEVLRERGIGTLVIDSFGPRGVTNTIGEQDQVPAYSMLVDAYEALKLLARHPRIDPGRIAIIGWSKGGTVADWASREWYRARLSEGDLRFAAHVAFYPWCGEQPARIELTGAPLLYLVGELDDWTGSETCLDYAGRVNRAGYEADIVVYEGAQHGFDYAGSFRTYLDQAENWSGCAYLFRDEGFITHASGAFMDWSQYLNYRAACTGRGAHLASHATARDRSLVRLVDFLSYVFDP